MNFDPILMSICYTLTTGTMLAIYHKKIINQLKKSVKQYLEYMQDVPIKYSVGK